MADNLRKYNFTYIISLALVSAMGGLLFGYDWVVIGGAKPFYEVYFDITNDPTLQGWAMSSALMGCIIGAALAGVLADKFGRKLLLIVAAVFFVVSAYGSGATDDFTIFIIFRLLGGVGIGLASTLSPMYIAEISPSEYRGRLVSLNQLTVVIGILAAQIVNMILAEPVATSATSVGILNSWNGQYGWRWMFWMELIPAILFLILITFVPESPRFLAKIEKEERVIKILTRIGGLEYAKKELRSIKETLSGNLKDKVDYKDLTDPKVLPILLLGIFLAVFQQWCGINVIFNYGQEIFQAAGYGVNDMFMNIVITGGVNLIFTFVAIKTVDNWGRRRLMVFGASGLALIYLIIGFMYYFEFTGWPVLVLVVAAIAIYAMSLAPITWVILSEIFPNRLRGVAMAIATLFLWIASFILTFTFPVLNNSLGASGTFWLYGIICVMGLIFILAKLPETKNKSLEEIEKQLSKNN